MRTLNKKTIFVAVLLFSLLVFAFNYSLLTVAPDPTSASEKEVSIQKDGNEVKAFGLTNKPKTFLLKRGTYHLDVTEGLSKSLYVKRLGFFGFNKQQVKTVKQKAADFLGKDPLGCAFRDGQEAVYYSCNPSSPAVIAHGDDGPVTAKREEGSVLVLKPYANGFIELKKVEGRVLIQKKNIFNQPASPQVEIREFGGELTDGVVATNVFNDSFAVFDRDTNVAYYYENIFSGPKSIALNLAQEKRYASKIFLTDNRAYINSIELNETAKAGQGTDEETSGENKVFYIDLKKAAVQKVHSLPKDWQVKNLAVIGQNELVAVLGAERLGEAFIIDGDSIKKGGVLPSEVLEVCVASDGATYIKSDGGKSIYRYIGEEETSYLLYASTKGFISSLHCVGANAYFSLDLTSDGDTENQLHYALTDRDQSGERLEDILPLYMQVNGSVIKATILPPADVLIDRVAGSTTASRDQVRAFVVKELKKNNVETSNISLRMNF